MPAVAFIRTLNFFCVWHCSFLESQFLFSGCFGLSETRKVAQHKDVTPGGLLTAKHLIPRGLLTATQRVPLCSEAGMKFPWAAASSLFFLAACSAALLRSSVGCQAMLCSSEAPKAQLQG